MNIKIAIIKQLLHIRSVAFYLHKRQLSALVKPIKKQRYTELKKLIAHKNLQGANEDFAYARFLKATEYARYSRDSGCPSSYSALRRNMGLAPMGVDHDPINPGGVAPGGYE